MKLKERIEILIKLGSLINLFSEEKEWTDYSLGINESEFNDFKAIIERAHIHNGWFTKESVLESLKGISTWLTEDSLQAFVEKYNINDSKSPKKIALILAGNIPMVGFHDVVCTFLSGHVAICKLSSNDDQLIPGILRLMELFNTEVNERILISKEFLKEIDAVIATGSDNSSTYFKSYFGKYPHIIRKNRTSLAIIEGNETKDELKELGKDIFTFYGLGCRNVSKLFVPENYKLDTFFESIYPYHEIINHNKYANNYDYNKAVYLLNCIQLLDNNFVLLKEDDSLHSPLGVLFYQTYKSKSDVEKYIQEHKDKIQVVVGKNYLPFGKAQYPSLFEFADGIDTIDFLTNLN